MSRSMSPIERMSRPTNPKLSAANNALLAVQDIVHASGLDIPTEPYGLGSTARLSSVRVDPAVKLLQNITWRGFFNPQEYRTSSLVATPILKGKEVDPSNTVKRASQGGHGTRPRSANASVRTLRERAAAGGAHEVPDGVDSDPMDDVFDDMVCLVQKTICPPRLSICVIPLSMSASGRTGGGIVGRNEDPARGPQVLPRFAMQRPAGGHRAVPRPGQLCVDAESAPQSDRRRAAGD